MYEAEWMVSEGSRVTECRKLKPYNGDPGGNQGGSVQGA